MNDDSMRIDEKLYKDTVEALKVMRAYAKNIKSPEPGMKSAILFADDVLKKHKARRMSWIEV
jgi:hypothetical protein